jgi:hypothetical protein
MQFEKVLTAVDRGEDEGCQKFRVEIVAYYLGSVYFQQLGAFLKDHDHCIDLLW